MQDNWPNARPAAPTAETTDSQPMIWVAQYVYAGPDGGTHLAVKRIRARSRDDARTVAERAAPGEEYLLTLVPESDDQFLGHVRLKAMAAKDK